METTILKVYEFNDQQPSRQHLWIWTTQSGLLCGLLCGLLYTYSIPKEGKFFLSSIFEQPLRVNGEGLSWTFCTSVLCVPDLDQRKNAKPTSISLLWCLFVLLHWVGFIYSLCGRFWVLGKYLEVVFLLFTLLPHQEKNWTRHKVNQQDICHLLVLCGEWWQIVVIIHCEPAGLWSSLVSLYHIANYEYLSKDPCHINLLCLNSPYWQRS